MKKVLVVLAVVAALGVGYWLISPLFITREVHESLADIVSVVPTPVATAPEEKSISQTPKTITQGAFVGLAAHNAVGTAKVLKVGEKYFVRFEDDFNVTNGPDLFVGFGKNGVYNKNAVVGALKGNVGSQNYEVPAGIDPSQYNEIWVWCRAFSVPFGRAVFQPVETERKSVHTAEWQFASKGEDQYGMPRTEVLVVIDGKKPLEIGVMDGHCAMMEESIPDDATEFKNRGTPINFVQCWWAGAGMQFGAFEKTDGEVGIFTREVGE